MNKDILKNIGSICAATIAFIISVNMVYQVIKSGFLIHVLSLLILILAVIIGLVNIIDDKDQAC